MKLRLSALLCFATVLSCQPHNFDPESKVKVFRVEFEIGINGKEVVITKPVILENGYLDIECHCGQDAVWVNYKDGKTVGYCEKHVPKINCSCGCTKRKAEYKSKKNKSVKS